MFGRPRSWPSREGDEEYRVSMKWPKSLWREIQQLALDRETTGTALVIEAVEEFLVAARKEETKKTDRKK
jgi:hypothetical protein